MTNEGDYLPFQKFTNKIVSDMLLRELHEEPSIGMPPVNENFVEESIESFLKNDKKLNIEDINIIFQFAIDLAADGTQIPLSMLTHGIAMRLKTKNKKTTEDTSNVVFETTLELIQDISVVLRKASPVHTQYVGDCHQCRLYCSVCDVTFGIKSTIFDVLYEAPYAILYHHGLELPENGLYDSSNDRFHRSLPMHTIPDELHDSGIEITKGQTAFGRCLFGNGYDLESEKDILVNRKSLHNLSEAMRIDSAFTGDIKARHYNTTAMLFSLFDVMLLR
jgi:hypothetical protein